MKRLLGAVIVAIMLAGPLAGLSIADCDAKLVGTAWDCNFTCSGGPYGYECLQFGYYAVSNDFDAYFSGFDGPDGCTCNPVGTNFDAAQKAFECTEVGYPSSLRGKLVSSHKITAQYWEWTGVSCKVGCTKRSSLCF